MLYFFSGTDTEKMRAALHAAIDKYAAKASILRVTDAHTPADLESALQGPGMFGGARVVVLENVLSHEEMRAMVMARLAALKESSSPTMIYHSDALDADTRKKIEKYAEKSERFDTKTAKKQETIFALANALQGGKKKDLWVGYQRELAAGKAPEAIHGVLFWAAKQALLRSDSSRTRALVASLAELPHMARRQGEDLEYALERFVLSSIR